MGFKVNDYVEVASGFSTGKKGRIIALSPPPSSYAVRMETTGDELGFIECQLKRDDVKMIRVYGPISTQEDGYYENARRASEAIRRAKR